MTAVIILNWNGYSDTIECLESLYAMDAEFFVVVADNGSTDSSVKRVKEYLDCRGIDCELVGRGGRLSGKPQARACVIYDIGENLGFARGNNEALRLLADYCPDHFLLLNNDTVVETDFLQVMDSFAALHPRISVFTPMICYESRRDVIWNCGGIQKMGFRKYYYADKPVKAVKESGLLRVTFLTGCALYFSPAVLRADGGVFTERFFFGEEDFNFCLRMNRERREMACVLDSRIYHKVSSSTAGHNGAGKLYIHYLNRFIDMRLNSTRMFYCMWVMMNVVYVPLLLVRGGMAPHRALRLVARVYRDARYKNAVSRDDFTAALNPLD